MGRIGDPGTDPRVTADRVNDSQMKNRIYEILEHSSSNDRQADVFGYFIIALISLNVIALIVGTVDSIYESAPWAFLAIEVFSVAVFSVEYVLRLWACTANPKYSTPLLGRFRFAASPVMVVDLLAILPFFASLILSVYGLDLRILRVFRLLVRIVRMGRYSTGLQTLARVVRKKRSELAMVIVLLGVLLLTTSSLVYFAEHEQQPDVFASIPESMWWSLITLSTIGYGDVVPMTAPGRLLAGITAVLGIGLFALPAGILGSGFVDELQSRRESTRTCPHCGKAIHD